MLFVSLSLSSQEKGLDDKINDFFEPYANDWEALVLYPIKFSEDLSIPIVLILLILGALFFTIIFKFPNIRNFPLAINTVRGKYDDIEKNDSNQDEGEVSHFQALATAVSGTVGLGNIAGVAVAIALGGPGATFWMIICGLIGMSTKFVECTLGVMYRDVDEHIFIDNNIIWFYE